MGSPVVLRTDYSLAQLRHFARRSKDTNQSRRLLSLAAVSEINEATARTLHRCEFMDGAQTSS